MRRLPAVLNLDTNARFSIFLVELLTPNDWGINLLQFLSYLPLLNIRIRQSCYGSIIPLSNFDHSGVIGPNAIGERNRIAANVFEVPICLSFQ